MTALKVICEALTGGSDDTAAIDAAAPMAYRIFNALVEAGYLPAPHCGDCGVPPGEPHIPGCDVARCKRCGYQAIGCDCPRDVPTLWTGRWPGEVEVEKYGLRDLNDLAARCQSGQFRWDRDAEQWEQ